MKRVTAVLCLLIILLFPKPALCAGVPSLYASWNQNKNAVEVDWVLGADIQSKGLDTWGTASYQLFCNGQKVSFDDSVKIEGSIMAVKGQKVNGKAYLYNVQKGKTYEFTLKGETGSGLPESKTASIVTQGTSAGFDYTLSYKYDANNRESAGTVIINWERDDTSQATMDVQYDISSAFGRSNTSQTINCGSKTKGSCSYVLAWANTDSYGEPLSAGETCGVNITYNGITKTKSVDGSGQTASTDLPIQESEVAPPVEAGQEEPTTQEEEAGGWVDKLLSAPINGIASALQLLGIKDFNELIFNQGESASMHIPPFIGQEAWDVAQTWFNYFYFASFGLIFCCIIFTGFKLQFTAYNPKKRQEATSAFMRWLYAFLIIWGAPMMIDILLAINNAGVSLCYNVAAGLGNIDMAAAGSTGTSFVDTIHTGHVLTTAIIKLGFVCLMVYFNVLYLIRDLIVVGLYAFTPFLVWMWALSNNETALKTWFGETTSVVFMQFAHAFSLCFFLSIISFLDVWWATFVALVTIIPFATMIRNIFQGFLRFLGMNEERVAGGALGMMAGAAKLAGSVGGKSGVGKAADLSKPGASGPFGLSKSEAGATGSLITAAKMAPWANKIGGALGTVAGLAMAAPLAAVNPGLGMTIGGATKGLTQSAVTKATTAGVLGGGILKNTGQNILKNPQNGLGGSLKQGIKDTATISVPGGGLFPGMQKMEPPSTRHALAGMVGAVTHNDPIDGYNQGKEAHKGAMNAGRSLSQQGGQMLSHIPGVKNYVDKPQTWK